MSRFPIGWRKRRIGDIAEIVSGATPKTMVKEYWDGDILWATPKDLGQLNSIEISDTERKITKAGYESCSTKLLPPGSVLLSSRAPIGHLAINTKPMCTNQGFKSLIPKKGIFNRYLYWVLKGSVTELQNMGRGCTFDELSKGLLASLEIPVPPLDEQRRIVARIEELTPRAEEARQLRQEAVEETSKVLKAAIQSFLECSEELIEAPVGQLCSMKTGKTPPTKKPEYFDGDVLFVCPSDLGKNITISNSERKLTSKAIEDGKANLFKSGTVLLVGIGSTVGKVGIANCDLCTNQQITGLFFNNSVHPEYAAWYLFTQQDVIKNAAAGGGVPIINQQGIAQLKIQYPRSVTEQLSIVNELNAIQEKTDKLIDIQDSIKQLLEAFQPALLAKAFRGEL